MPTAKIIETKGAQYPNEIERVYRLRAGSKGAGKILAEHRARGDYRATDAAIQDLTNQAAALGYQLVD
jgi:hypothetical protein